MVLSSQSETNFKKRPAYAKLTETYVPPGSESSESYVYTDRLQEMGHDGKNWERYELHKSIGPVRYDNCSMNSRPSPKEQIVRQGMRPHPGPRNDDQSRGQKEGVLGKEVGVDDVYSIRFAIPHQRIRGKFLV